MSIALIDNFAIEWTVGAGRLKAGDSARADERSVFQTGSVSKFVTAAAGSLGDRLYLEILAALAIEYGWPGGQPFKP